MNIEKFCETLQACYFGDKGAFNKCMYEFSHLQQENEQLKKQKEELKDIIKETREKVEETWKLCEGKNIYVITLFGMFRTQLLASLDKMNELEGEDK
jgi:hypothetical protein